MYNYLESMKKDVLNWIDENVNLCDWESDRDGLEEKLNDDLWFEDRITGNASGSYTFNRWKAQEYVVNNIDKLKEVLEEFSVDAETITDKFLSEDWEYFDVTIRCYFLGQAIAEALEELQL